MILEIAEIHVRPGEQTSFEAAMHRALGTITARAAGMQGYQLLKCMESPERYLLQVKWGAIDDHMVTYRSSPQREEWRAIVSPFYAKPPTMEHFEVSIAR